MSIQFHKRTEVGIRREAIVTRRDVLRGIPAAAIAAGALSWSDLVSVQAANLRRQGKAVILLWMQGGPSQFETFSPKPGTTNGGETKAISTAVPGIEVSENFPKVAEVMKDVAIIRSMTSKEGSHPRAQFLMHTGYLPTATVKYPSLGGIAAHEIADRASELPAYVRIGGRGGSGLDGGYFGVECDPFAVGNAGTPPTNAQPTSSTERYRRRLDLLKSMEAEYASIAPQEVSDHQKLYEKASKMILSSDMKAFDLSQETKSLREGYGSSQFASGCLLARRLVEHGVTCVEVVHQNWDTHDDNFKRSKTLSEQVDQPFAKLVRDLKDRGLLETTLVVWMGEFGRTPTINPRTGRDHYPRAFNLALSGCGIRGGQVIGETDRNGVDVTKRSVAVNDLFQTFCRCLDITSTKETVSNIGRPIKIVDGGKPVHELFS